MLAPAFRLCVQYYLRLKSGKQALRWRSAYRKCTGECPCGQHLKGDKGRRQKEDMSCDTVTTEASANPLGSSVAGMALAQLSCLEARAPGLYIFPYCLVRHWMQLPLGRACDL